MIVKWWALLHSVKPYADTRTVDELLSFIDGEKSASAAASEAKREKRKMKRQQKKSTALPPQPVDDATEQAGLPNGCSLSQQGGQQKVPQAQMETIGSASRRVRLKNGGSDSPNSTIVSLLAEKVCKDGFRLLPIVSW